MATESTKTPAKSITINAPAESKATTTVTPVEVVNPANPVAVSLESVPDPAPPVVVPFLKRTLTRNVLDEIPLENQVAVQVLDEPGPDKSNHQYRIRTLPVNPDDPNNLNPSDQVRREADFQDGMIPGVVDLQFQTTVTDIVDGVETVKVVTGVTNEALLAVVIDRLRGFQSGPFYSQFNESAARHCESALEDLHVRTRERIRRSVLGARIK